MAKVLEDIGKNLIGQMGFPTTNFQVAKNSNEAVKAHEEINDNVVIKALVPVGKRKKAGAIKFSDDPKKTNHISKEILNMKVRGYSVEKILIEEKLDIAEELYLSVVYDKKNIRPVVIASTKGGIDIEKMTSIYPESINKVIIDPFKKLPNFKARELWSELGYNGNILCKLTNVTVKLFEAFYFYDCTTLEINPLVITKDNKIIGADCVMVVDDLAIFRQNTLSKHIQIGSERTWRPLTELEKRVVEINERDPYRGTARYIELDDGDIGFMCGGGGGSLVMFDSLVKLGLKPSNYTEFGGNPPIRKIRDLVKVILSKKDVKGLLVCGNITNNTQVDNVAKGVKEALKEKSIDLNTFPVVVRYAGVNDKLGKEIFESMGIEYHGEDITMPQAGKIMKEKLKEFYS